MGGKKARDNKTTVAEPNNAFDGLISRLDMTENKNIWAREYINRIVENWKAKKTNSEKKKKKNKPE